MNRDRKRQTRRVRQGQTGRETGKQMQTEKYRQAETDVERQ